MTLSGWGRYPVIESTKQRIPSAAAASRHLKTSESTQQIARGLGRSYGDSSLAETHLDLTNCDQFISFNADTGLLTCMAGVSFAEILRVFIPKGWFLPVTPGTQFVTVGGAIASDVHGKNHHLDGSFAQHVTELSLCLANGDIIECSPEHHRELFLATCGGMGLTGVILQASFKLKRIASSYIDETTYKTANLTETLERFEQQHDATYSVAWIDCLATGEQMGRSLLMLGEHAEHAADDAPALKASRHSKLNMPFNLPDFTLNRYSIKAFNTLYYSKVRHEVSTRLIDYAPFFYPLDAIQNWNRMYGKHGFVQYQFVIPKSAGQAGLSRIFEEIVASRRGSFLAVLKVFGPGNDHYLSFPIEGYTLALDFKIDASLFEFLERLDRIVLDFGGRLYLTKDARMSEQTFKQSYPQWEQFQSIREQFGALKTFNSLQSQRIGL